MTVHGTAFTSLNQMDFTKVTPGVHMIRTTKGVGQGSPIENER